MKWVFIGAVTVVISFQSAHATDLDCVSTTFKALSPNDKVCVSVFCLAVAHYRVWLDYEKRVCLPLVGMPK